MRTLVALISNLITFLVAIALPMACLAWFIGWHDFARYFIGELRPVVIATVFAVWSYVSLCLVVAVIRRR